MSAGPVGVKADPLSVALPDRTANVTAPPEVAVALSVTGVPITRLAGSAPSAISCDPFAITSVPVAVPA